MNIHKLNLPPSELQIRRLNANAVQVTHIPTGEKLTLNRGTTEAAGVAALRNFERRAGGR